MWLVHAISMVDADSLSEAEQRLVEAVKTGSECDFANGQGIRARDMADWGAERAVRADVLWQVLRGEHLGTPEASLALRGAAITGTLDLTKQSIPPIRLECCRLDDVCFERATFRGDAGFKGSSFTGDANLELATFTGDAGFEGSSFTGDANFDRATFDRPARFENSSFAKRAIFEDASFARLTNFAWARFKGTANFKGATFAPAAHSSEGNDKKISIVAFFDEARFDGDAWFEDATFVGNAQFERATFATTAWFKGARFTARVSFRKADFTGGTVKTEGPMWQREPRVRAAEFTGALARTWDLTAAKFHTPDPGPWIGETVILNSAVLFARSTVEIRATTQINAQSMQAPEGAHLVIDSPSVDLTDADFLRPSIVAGGTVPIPDRRGKMTYGDSLRDQTRASAEEKADELRDTIAGNLSRAAHECRLTSLKLCTTGDLVLSKVVLDECTFAGAYSLDKMRIGADCSFRRTRDRKSTDAFTQRRMVTGRRLIAEEIEWRKAHPRRTDRHTNEHVDQQNRSEADQPNQPADQQKQPAQVPASPLLPADIAGIYRDLRKGLEDVKNEPEAADFYYGEMEMRRLAGLARGDGSDERLGRGLSVEHILLSGYWAVSGYGLRAWRATTMLAVLIVAAALAFSHPGLATPPERIASINPKDGAVTYVQNPQAPGFLAALNFSARESVSLLHADADSASVKTQGAGTLIDCVLRLAGPVLLAFIVLALRARTKR
jgi:hypothetical protein